MDFYPTFMQAIGAKPNNQHFDGIDLTKKLENTAAKLPDRKFYWHYPLDKPHFLGGRSAGSIRDGDWKLIEFFDDSTSELYNLKEDIGETRNLAAENPEKVKTLSKELHAWRKEVNAK
jgi:arylsulfatase A-like enzyme